MGSELRHQVERFGPDAFAMSVTAESRPHVAPVQVAVVDDDSLEVLVLPGSRTERNAAAHPTVCLHWPGTAATDGYSLIVDAHTDVVAREHDTLLRLTATKAVLHKLGAPGAQTSACGHDCVGVALDDRA